METAELTATGAADGPLYPPPDAPPSPKQDVPLEPHMLYQGAEARVFVVGYFGRAAVVKQRFKKKYRHPELDAKLTSQRIVAEARNIVRCRKAGVDVPAIFDVDADNGCLLMEYIDGISVKEFLMHRHLSVASTAQVADQIGTSIARMHSHGLIHGDLTTSNLMLRRHHSTDFFGMITCDDYEGREASCTPSKKVIIQEGDEDQRVPVSVPSCDEGGEGSSWSVVVLDLGLSFGSIMAEDRAVDLYVLERAIRTSHPDKVPFFERIISAYRASAVDGPATLRKLEEVQKRGRKRVMIG